MFGSQKERLHCINDVNVMINNTSSKVQDCVKSLGFQIDAILNTSSKFSHPNLGTPCINEYFSQLLKLNYKQIICLLQRKYILYCMQFLKTWYDQAWCKKLAPSPSPVTKDYD